MSRRCTPVDERFFAKVDTGGVCWEWTAALGQHGYGVFQLGRGAGTALAHRWSYEFLVGAIPEGLTLDHLCRNRRCVNPDHTEPVTPKINTLRSGHPSAHNARKAACPKCGGPYSPQIIWGVQVGRFCRPCHSAWQLAKYQSSKEA